MAEVATPSLLSVALDLLYDRCPRDSSMYLCKLQEDDEDGGTCERCWEHYLFYVANGCVRDPYESERRRDDV